MINERDYRNLTHPEKRVYYLQNYYDGTSMWNLSVSSFFKNGADEKLLKKAINLFIKNNQNARIRVTEINSEPKQYYSPHRDIDFETFDFTDAVSGETDYRNWATTFARKAFKPFLDSNLFYFAIVKLAGKRTGFFMKVHHIAFDGSSLAVCINKITEYYKKLAGGEAEINETFPSYELFIEQEENYLKSDDFSADAAYWNKMYESEIEQLELKPGALNDDCRLERTRFKLSEKLSGAIYAYCDKKKVSAFKVFISAVYAYLSRISLKDDIVIETAHHNRTPELMQASGMYVSTISHRLNVSVESSFDSLLDQFLSSFSDTMKRQRYPADLLVSDLRAKQRGTDSMFAVTVVQYLESYYSKDVETEFFGSGESINMLTFYLSYDNKAKDKIEFYLDYKTSVYTAAEIDIMCEHISSMLSEAVAEPDKKIYEIDFLTDAEKRRLIYELNNSDAYFPKDKTFVDLFDEQAARTPDKRAVVYKERSLTYRELSSTASRLALKLRGLGIKRNDIVGIYIQRVPEMMIGIIAALKAGAAYMPIDTRYPAERIEFMLSDSSAKVMLTQKELIGKLDFKGVTIDLEDPSAYESAGEIENVSKAEDLAYVIYTSGSTGKPKGTLLQHDSLLNFCYWYKNSHELSADDRMAKHSSFGFDVSIIETFPPLLVGAEIHLISEEIRLSLIDLNEYFERNKITVAFIVTQLAEQFIENIDNKSLRWLDAAGEKLRIYKPRNFRLLNGYGPTECTVYTTAFEVDKNYDNIPIGRPLYNTRLYILDKYGNLMPEGYAGELCVSGVCVARGYLNRPEVNAQKYIACPYDETNRMYRTGDLVRWLPDGNIEYFGRMDNQVKLRGFRIELGEIEQALMKIDEIKDSAVVMATDKNGSAFLCAYAVTSETELDEKKLRSELSKALPEYMLPACFVKMDKMPLSPNGKIDRKSLPAPLIKAGLESEFVKCDGETEEKIAKIWCELLGLERVGALDNFFKMGGHSLKAIVLQAKLNKLFNSGVTLNDIFAAPTIRGLAQKVLKIALNEKPALKKAEDRPSYPMASAQKRMYILDRMQGPNITYNVPIEIVIDGELDMGKLSNALDKMVERHEALRTSFDISESEPVQIINKNARLKKLYAEACESELDDLRKDFVKPFNLSAAPLMRVKLVKTDENRHILMLDLHHIIFDGMSIGVFMNELWALYAGRDLKKQQYQYKDYAIWQEKLTSSASFARQEKFWLDSFSGDIPTLDLPTDRPRQATADNFGATYDFIIERDLSSALKNLAAKSGSTLYMVLLSAFDVLLSRYSGHEDVVVGTPAGGRELDEFQEMIGMFVNTLAIRSNPAHNRSFSSFLAENRDRVINVFQNQDYQLENLIDKLNLARENSRNPLFDTFFALQNMQMPSYKDDLIDARLRQAEGDIAKFDLSLDAFEHGEIIKFVFEYRTSLYDAPTIARMARHFTNILKAVTGDCDVLIKDINLISGDEREILIKQFNSNVKTYDKTRLAHSYFEEMAALYPDKTAVVYKENSLSYKELNEKANALAAFLRKNGAAPDGPIGIMAERSVDVIVAIMAVLKSGGCYVPIDPNYPADRIDYMIEDSGIKVLLSKKYLKDKCKFNGLTLDLADWSSCAGGGENLEPISKPSNIAYIIYTSGSTGKPKGVMIEHRALNNLINWHRSNYSLTFADNCAEYASFSFDASISATFSALSSGATLHIISEEMRLAPDEINRYIEENKITYIDLPTQFCECFMETTDNRSLKLITTGGDKLHKFTPRNYRLCDEYGPTEYTVITTSYPVSEKSEKLPIGKPIANTRVYMIDKNKNLQPIGVAGELCIAGDGIARGYLNRPDLTSEKFIDDPFVPGAKMYRTGDLARWLADGNIDFIGRVDYQVKIRGFRVELGEIEQLILAVPGVKESAVVARNDNSGNKYLCGYYVSGSGISSEELKTQLGADLPKYMVPEYLIKLDKMPLSPSGKINRKELPMPDLGAARKFVAPASDIEKRIVRAWEEVLGVSNIGVEDNFFALGGHSLRAITLTAKLQSDFEVKINDIFKHQTIRELAANISERKGFLKSKLALLKKHELENASYMNDPAVSAEAEKYRRENERYERIDVREVKRYDNILLCGVTGYLGIHLLYESLCETNSTISVLVRGKNADDCEKRLFAKINHYFGPGFYERYKSRVNIINGDLSKELFGLDKKTYDSLAAKIDCIINAAALVKHYGNYDEFYLANVSSVKSLVEFAKTQKRKDLNHVSTVSVGFGKIEGTERFVFTESHCDVNQKIDNFYVETKLQSEKVAIAARNEGIVSNIFRVGNLVYNSRTGILQDNIEENGFFNTLRSYVNLGFSPAGEANDLSSVDMVAKAIIKLFNRAKLENETYHIINPNNFKTCDLATAPGVELNIEGLSFDKFIDYISKNLELQRPAWKKSFENIMLHNGWLCYDEKGQTNFITLSERSCMLLKKTGFIWPEYDLSMMKRMLAEALADRITFIRSTPIFAGLSDSEVFELALRAKDEYFDEDVPICWEGEASDKLILIEDGAVELMKHSSTGWLGTIRVMGSREFLGENGLFRNAKAPYTAEACFEPARALVFNKSDMLKFIAKCPQLGFNFLSELSGRVETLATLMVDMG